MLNLQVVASLSSLPFSHVIEPAGSRYVTWDTGPTFLFFAGVLRPPLLYSTQSFEETLYSDFLLLTLAKLGGLRG
jgi:hypothetical protein